MSRDVRPIIDVERLSVVMTVKACTHHGHSELERIRQLLLPSLARFLDPDCVDTFWVVALPDEKDQVARVVAPFREALKIRLVTDDEVAPRAAGTSGWVKQQILKLGIARRVETGRYLVLDSDVLAVRPIGWKELCPNGTALLGREPLSTHPDWWRASASILGIDLSWGHEERVMGVTPQILYTEVCRALLERIETHGRRWPWSRRAWERILLARPGWTEYSLYWLFLCNRFAVDDHYSIDHGGLYGNCVWRRAAELDADRVRRMFEEPVAPFSVIQSNIEALRVEDVVRLVEPWIRAG